MCRLSLCLLLLWSVGLSSSTVAGRSGSKPSITATVYNYLGHAEFTGTWAQCYHWTHYGKRKRQYWMTSLG